MTQQVKPTPEEIAAWIEKHYAGVMTPWQLDLLKRTINGDPIPNLPPRVIARHKRLIKEAIAVVSAGQ